MNKDEFIIVLQCSLFAFDGMSVQEICSKSEIPEHLAKAGSNLAKYLKSIDLKESAKSIDLKESAK